jgi:sulfur-oxidizing protein SoxY
MQTPSAKINVITACALGAILSLPCLARADEASDRAQRWHDLSVALFGNRVPLDGSGFLTLQAPARADDAALVPVTITTSRSGDVKSLYLVIDDNPAPMAAHFIFGPAADPSEIRLRVRVNQYTNVHAIAEGRDGRLYQVSQFVKAAGGCSAPAGASEADALRGIGQMKLRTLSAYMAGKPMQVQLLMRHPNFNGMQMNQVTRLYTMARFIDRVDVRYGGVPVFHLDSDISMSTDPAITFAVTPAAKGELSVTAHDTANSVFSKDFVLPAQGS